MPMITPDTSDALDMSPIPPGTYLAKVTNAETGISKAQNPKVVVHLDITVPGRRNVMKRQAHLAIAGQGSGGFDQMLRASGFEALAEQYRDPQAPNPPFNTDDLIGKEFNVVIESGINPTTGGKNDNIQTYLKA